MKLRKNEGLMPIFVGGICVAMMLMLFSMPFYSSADNVSPSKKVIGIAFSNYNENTNISLYHETLDFAAENNKVSFVLKNAANDPIAQKQDIVDFYSQLADEILVIPCNYDFLIQSLREIDGSSSIIWVLNSTQDSYSITNIAGETRQFSSINELYSFFIQ